MIASLLVAAAVAASAQTAPSARDLAADLIALAEAKGYRPGPEAHGAPTATIALGSYGGPEFSVSVMPGCGGPHRQDDSCLRVRRARPKFLLGYDAYGFESWGDEVEDVLADSEGGVTLATFTTPLACASQAACPKAALEPRRVSASKGGPLHDAFVGRMTRPLDDAQTRALLSAALALARAR